MKCAVGVRVGIYPSMASYTAEANLLAVGRHMRARDTIGRAAIITAVGCRDMEDIVVVVHAQDVSSQSWTRAVGAVIKVVLALGQPEVGRVIRLRHWRFLMPS